MRILSACSRFSSPPTRVERLFCLATSVGWRARSKRLERAWSSLIQFSRRPGLVHALAAVESREASVLIVAKLDRLSRSVVDFAGLAAQAQRKGWAIVALDIGLDMTSAAGGLMANVMAAVAEWERKVIGERTAAALAARCAAGVKLGRPREQSQEAIERIRDLHRSGVRPSEIARVLNREGVPTPRGGRWHPPGVTRVLSWSEAA